MQIHQPIHHVRLLLREFTTLLFSEGIEVILNLELRIKLRTEPIDILVVGKEELTFGHVGVVTKHIAHEISSDIWLHEAVTIAVDTHIPKILHSVWQCRYEMSAEPPYSRLGHLPNTEETEDMVDSVCIEIILHLGETTSPPKETIFCHFVPVIRGEAPVLTGDGEIIRWRTC